MTDHYSVLGLSNNASKEEIKEAFRKLALKFHPDKHSQSPKAIRDGATLRFKQVSEAYEVLSDDRKRAEYNNRRFGGVRGSGYDYTHSYNYGWSSRKNQSSYRRTAPSNGNKWGFDFDVALRVLTRRGFLLNLAFASLLLGGAVVIERSGQTLWKMHNSGKSFEEAMESIEKMKTQKEKR